MCPHMPVYKLIRCCTICNIVWLSLMRVTDWLNILTWLKHNLECSPPQSCGGGTLIATDKMFSLGGNFSCKQMATWACDTIASKWMFTALDRALAVYCAQSTIDTHCTTRNLKKIPAKKNTELCEFLLVMQKPGKAMGSHKIEQMATLLSGTSRHVPSILGLKFYLLVLMNSVIWLVNLSER